MRTDARMKQKTGKIESIKSRERVFNNEHFNINFDSVNHDSIAVEGIKTVLNNADETESLVLDGNVITILNARQMEKLYAHNVEHIRNIAAEKTMVSSHERTIILDLKKGMIEIYMYIKGILHSLLIRLGLEKNKPNPILEEFKKFSLLQQMYCTSDVEIIAFHSAFGRAYYELIELTKNMSTMDDPDFDRIKKVFYDFMETFIW